MTIVHRAHSGYFSRAWGNLDTIAAEMAEALASVEYDTMIGTGLSGTLVVPSLARALDKHWAIVRKEPSPHTSLLVEGDIGERWVFVDDFVCSGSTKRRVRAAIEGIRVWRDRSFEQEPLATVYVGTYQYEVDRRVVAPFIPA